MLKKLMGKGKKADEPAAAAPAAAAETEATPVAGGPFRAKALYPFEAAVAGDLTLVEGDELTVHAEDGDWYVGAKDDGSQGYFPKSYVEAVKEADGKAKAVAPGGMSINLSDLKKMRSAVKAGDKRVNADDIEPFSSNTDDPLGRWTVKDEVFEGADPTERFFAGARTGSMALMEEVIKENVVPINSKNPVGDSALHLAARGGHIEVATLLLKQKDIMLNILDKEDRATPLHIAVGNDDVPFMQLLIKARANPTLKDKAGHRPIDIAQSDEAADLLEKAVFTFRMPKGAIVAADDDEDED